MQYDVFISYSRKDSEVANRICKAFDEVGITYFIDRQGISGGFEFPTVLAEAIINCKIFLYLASRNSYESRFTQSEITFAFNEKPKGSILPYIIDGSTMPPALRFVFSNINWRRLEEHPINTVLVDDLLHLLGKNRLIIPGNKIILPESQYKKVNLGLSVCWAECNIGASSPEEYGDYFAWGETEEKNNYDWSTYKWCKGSNDTMTKYCTNGKYGTVDNKTVLDPADDVAHVKWGGSWRMPTKDEIKELVNKCSWQWTTVNGVNGYKVTGPNGNSIFLPAAGYRYGTELFDRGSFGYYWSGTLDEDYSGYAYRLDFSSGGRDWYNNSRDYGHTVRPVTE